MDITGANATLMFTLPGLYQTPQQIQNFAADDIYDLDSIDPTEVLMGADGKLSGGFVFKAQPQSITLQADSPSCDFFDTWMRNQKAGIKVYVAGATLALPALGLKMIQTKGFLTSYKLPGAKKLVGPRRFQVTWEDVTPQPA